MVESGKQDNIITATKESASVYVLRPTIERRICRKHMKFGKEAPQEYSGTRRSDSATHWSCWGASASAKLLDWFVRILNEELEKFNKIYVDKEGDFIIRFQRNTIPIWDDSPSERRSPSLRINKMKTEQDEMYNECPKEASQRPGDPATRGDDERPYAANGRGRSPSTRDERSPVDDNDNIHSPWVASLYEIVDKASESSI